MERGSGKISSSAGSKKMEKDSDRQKKMEGHCSIGQSSQRAVVPVEEEEDEEEEEEEEEVQLDVLFICILYSSLFLALHVSNLIVLKL
jgi:hypothetical protein